VQCSNSRLDFGSDAGDDADTRIFKRIFTGRGSRLGPGGSGPSFLPDSQFCLLKIMIVYCCVFFVQTWFRFRNASCPRVVVPVVFSGARHSTPSGDQAPGNFRLEPPLIFTTAEYREICTNFAA